MQRRGTVTMLLPPGQRPPDKQAGQKKRQERKKTARGAFGEDSSDDDGDVSAGKYTPGNAMPLEFHEKTKEMEASMIAALKKKAPFDAHDDADLARLVAAMAPVEFADGVDVVRQGEAGDLAYWVEEGELTVLADGKEVDTISAHAVFGEVALVYDLTRTATIRTKTRARMWLLHRHMFQHILRNRHIEARKAKFAFLRTVKIFAKLSSRQISRVADVADTVTFDADDVIIAQGDQADSMYLIEEGQAVVSQKQDGVGGAGSSQHGSASGEGGEGGEGEEGAAASEPSLLRILKPGDYFGEKALLTDGTLRTATVTAASQVTCLRLDQQSFTELLGELREELIRRAPKDDRPAQKQPPPPPPPPPQPQPQPRSRSRRPSWRWRPPAGGESPFSSPPFERAGTGAVLGGAAGGARGGRRCRSPPTSRARRTLARAGTAASAWCATKCRAACTRSSVSARRTYSRTTRRRGASGCRASGRSWRRSTTRSSSCSTARTRTTPRSTSCSESRWGATSTA